MIFGSKGNRAVDFTPAQAGPRTIYSSSPGHTYEGRPVNRREFRALTAMDRKARKRSRPDPSTPKPTAKQRRKAARQEASQFNGLEKIRAFHRRANLLVLPYSHEEQRAELVKLQDEFNENNGVLAADSFMHLNLMTNGQAERVTELWQLMIDHEVDMDGIDSHPDQAPAEDNEHA